MFYSFYFINLQLSEEAKKNLDAAHMNLLLITIRPIYQNKYILNLTEIFIWILQNLYFLHQISSFPKTLTRNYKKCKIFLVNWNFLKTYIFISTSFASQQVNYEEEKIHCFRKDLLKNKTTHISPSIKFI